MKSVLCQVTLLSLLVAVQCRDIPSNVQAFYDSVKSGRCEGKDKLQGGFHDTDDGPACKPSSHLASSSPILDGQTVLTRAFVFSAWSYCQKGVAGQAIFLHGPSTFANMDIDCDGDLSDPGDGRCGKSQDTQGQTAFVDEVKKFGIKDLNANIHPFVVFGNEDTSPDFKPQKYGIKPLSVMAVICGKKLVSIDFGSSSGLVSVKPDLKMLTKLRYTAFGVTPTATMALHSLGKPASP